MSLYNMLFGMNPLTTVLKEILYLDKVPITDYPKSLTWKSSDGSLGFDFEPVVDGNEKAEKEWEEFRKSLILKECYPTGRFRDIYYDKKRERIVLYTRNGGGNRPYYSYVFDLLQKHPNYVCDYDDDYDCTYAYIEFSVPELYKKALNDLVADSKIESVSQKFDRIIKEMEGMEKEDLKKDKRFKGVMEILEKITKEITKEEK